MVLKVFAPNLVKKNQISDIISALIKLKNIKLLITFILNIRFHVIIKKWIEQPDFRKNYRGLNWRKSLVQSRKTKK